MTETKTVYMPTQLVVLGILTAVGIGLGIVLGAFQINMAGQYGSSPAEVAALGLWSNFLLIVGVIAAVGALVLSGVRAILRTL